MDSGAEEIDDAYERWVVRRQARRVRLKSLAATVVVALGLALMI